MDEAMFDAGFYDDLDGSLAEAWSRLVRGAADRRSTLHTVQIATVAPDGPRVRTVVLRGADPAARTVRVHTDTRSEKAAQIVADPRVEICAYDQRAKIQLRLRGLATLHRDGAVAEAAWAATGPGSRVCYRAALGPGTAVAHPSEADPAPDARAPADADRGRIVFAAVTVAVQRIDWLYLAARGHRRAGFAWTGTAWQGHWLAP
jgi:hypothetical protein